LVYIPTGDIFILAKRVKHILVHGVNLDWHEGQRSLDFPVFSVSQFSGLDNVDQNIHHFLLHNTSFLMVQN
jgi:CRISPR/Cas system CMR-associated protein Cmr1 (group 7 of RAMP superfamily)